jgi:predicted TIM-barrel fold metal-dependent hydrolase
MSTRPIALDEIVAIDFHTHVEMSESGVDSLPDELRDAAVHHFRGESARPTALELAEHYRARRMMAVIFTVDSESFTGQPRVPNEEIAAAARANPDVLIPFASIDPHKGRRGVDEARRLIAEHGVRGFKFHPNVQGFFPNDRMAYPLYEVIEEAGLPALFHTGQSGVGSGLPGGGGVRLKYSNPMHVDDVAVDFPELKIVLAHPSFPWQDEACTSRRSTSICRAGRRSTFRLSSSSMPTPCCASGCSSGPTTRSSAPSAGSPISMPSRSSPRCDR